MTRMMGEKEAEDFVLKVLREAEEPLLTREIEERTKNADGQCPDSAVRFLNKLRFKGIIRGELSIERKGWIWWVD